MPTKEDTRIAEIVIGLLICTILFSVGVFIHYGYLEHNQNSNRIQVVETYTLNKKVSPSVYYTTGFINHSKNIELAQEFKNFITKYNSPPNNFKHIQYDAYDMHVLALDNGYELQCIVNYEERHSKGVILIQNYTWVEVEPNKGDLK